VREFPDSREKSRLSPQKGSGFRQKTPENQGVVSIHGERAGSGIWHGSQGEKSDWQGNLMLILRFKHI
jgi:hypothetical protein